jgi:NitT/TauT family transport system ATP-binding protein
VSARPQDSDEIAPRGQQEVRVRIQGVSKYFGVGEGRFAVLRDLDLDIRDGEVVCVVGPSGSGKTTMLNLIGGFLDPDDGQVLIDGTPVQGPGAERGVVFQQYAVFPWLTVHDNIAFGLKLRSRAVPKARREEIVRHYIDLMGLSGFENAYPKTLSGGMRQRVAIARAYAVDPEILLMDEPFGALDAQTRDLMGEQLLNVMEQEGKTVLFITHAVEEAIFLAHRVVVLTKRPARIREIVDIPLPYPRSAEDKTTEEFVSFRRKIEELLRSDPPPDETPT